METAVVHGSLIEVDVEAIVNAANSQGLMGGGVAGFLKKAAGAEVEAEAVAQAPIPVGQAAVTSAGALERCRAIIHAPTMERPAMRIPPENVYQATRGLFGPQTRRVLQASPSRGWAPASAAWRMTRRPAR